MKCFYHSADLDGHCSGAIVAFFEPKVELIGINYGDPFPWERIETREIIYMVDFGLQPFEDMLRLNEICKANLVWIDHHVSRIAEPGAHLIAGIRANGKAACELTWRYFSHREIPMAVNLLGRYDVWDFEEGKDGVLPFQWGMRLHETRPEKASIFWDRLLTSEPLLVNKVMDEGKVALKFQKMENEKVCRASCFETELDGLKIIAANRSFGNSMTFDSVWDPSKYDAMLAFYRLPSKLWTVSLFTDKEGLDLSKICKARGGGGHAQAAGFQCAELPFEH